MSFSSTQPSAFLMQVVFLSACLPGRPFLSTFFFLVGQCVLARAHVWSQRTVWWSPLSSPCGLWGLSPGYQALWHVPLLRLPHLVAQAGLKLWSSCPVLRQPSAYLISALHFQFRFPGRAFKRFRTVSHSLKNEQGFSVNRGKGMRCKGGYAYLLGTGDAPGSCR